MNVAEIQAAYAERHPILQTIAVRIAADLTEKIRLPRIDRIAARAKAIDRFVAKATTKKDGKAKYSDPLMQIQDQIGARVVGFYLDDAIKIANQIKDYFRHVEEKELISENPKEFGYVGLHFILFIPDDLIEAAERENCPRFFELQVKTLFQHAWSEAEHDLMYKPFSEFTREERRKVAFTAAQAWGAE